ncbi:uncharacterized protein LOC117575669 isoform X1 [Drosophila albomicans]|uniref:Uncharacterized protein LOC117575669 isoform X1 n=1 Tax=Drosophila albomicans TaxID=7291 RepID=A0A6P8XHC2_DROAB|nr:uncharacterized protein LOC117575669 isoform X1 [Drosophila albomicans]
MSNLQLTQEKLDALRSEYRPRRPCALLKYPRPKTKPEYQSLYPWIILDETDPHFVFCAVCECRLSAKRSDLGKHEGSIKHSENAQRKSLSLSNEVKAEGANGVKWEFNDDEDGIVPSLGFGADVADMCKTEEDEVEAEADAEEDEADADAEVDDDDDGEVDGDADLNSEYEPQTKRRVSETDSQNSGMLEYLPLQVTINELPHVQLTPAAQLSAHCQQQPMTSTPQPCRITIKKVTAPTLSSTTTNSCQTQQQEITSKATITPISSGCYTPTVRQPQLQSYASRQLQSYQLQHIAARDSLDLFFDSICATVKTLPPKLATEGKIRVMQLIGELELRAINEREAVPTVNPIGTPPDASASTGTADAPGSSQQNATVASTTK